ncbi:TniB family NTP-binding protein [Pseudoduganella umbonata]|uniref:Transposase n=1 Tax=Pseudoduganella umbonata TaxID=864828 RepID=A0A4P8HTG9_9BURK|nr:TniB family NTP-binding protein [Pseudoduganella umbonata]MBB3224466.1 hypothetical protein [Pseudoduganella umbonata]QCP13239.1 transposase [Pseudoduganella umbonata]
MTTVLSHLAPDAMAALELPSDERDDFCKKDRWIGYERATQIMQQLDEVLLYPRTLRMPNVLIVGQSGNGKSAILKQFCDRHPVQITAAGDPVAPVLPISMPETPDEAEIWSEILWALGVSHGERDSTKVPKSNAKSVMKYANIRVLAIDEFNNLVYAGRRAADILALIKGISNDLKISIVAAGTQAAINALNSEPQMKSRFEPAALDRWRLDTTYLRFLASFERTLPLAEPSNLASRELAPLIYGIGGETIGGTVKLLKAAACKAIELQRECIDADVLKKANIVRRDGWDDVMRRI